MRLRTLVYPVAVVAVVGAAGTAGYVTRAQWLPYIFPATPDAKAPTATPDPHAGHDHEPHDDRVTLSPQAQANLGLKVGVLVPQKYWRTILIPGSVVDRPGESDRGVTTKVAGVVIDINARPGDTVRPGDPLFTLQLASDFIQAAQADLAKTAREVEFAAAKRDRVANLVKQGTQSGAVLIEEENQVKRLTTLLRAHRRQLQVFGLTPAQVASIEKGEVITEITIAAPQRMPAGNVVSSGTADGGDALFEVQELKVHLGDQVQAGQSLALLSDHQRLFVEGRAFKSEAGALAVAAEKKVPITVEFPDEVSGEWPEQKPLTIRHLSNQVDPATRTFAFYLPLENQPRTFTRDGKTFFVWRYRPGQRVRLRVPVEELFTRATGTKTPVLPFVLATDAVVREGPEAFVFAQSGDTFIRNPVRVLYEDGTQVVIANDGSITAADHVVKNQAAAINRALKTAAAEGDGGHDHGHDHGH